MTEESTDLPGSIVMRCSRCHSTDVRRDGIACWNPSRQQWELIDVLDDGWCEECGAEGRRVIEEHTATGPDVPSHRLAGGTMNSTLKWPWLGLAPGTPLEIISRCVPPGTSAVTELEVRSTDGRDLPCPCGRYHAKTYIPVEHFDLST